MSGEGNASVSLTDEELRAHPLPSLEGAADKHQRGRVLVVAGGAEVPGAAVLCGLAALRAGAGVLQLAAAPAWATPLALAMPEARVVRVRATAEGDIAAEAAPRLIELAAKVDAVVLGPGMLDEAAACQLARSLCGARPPARLVIDAGALGGALAGDLANPAVLTPHAGEAAAILGVSRETIEADPAAASRAIAGERGAVVAVKGPATHIAAPDGRLWRHEGGVIGLGTGGSGDCLAGLIAGLAARGADPVAAALWGVFVHAAAGQALSRRVAKVGFLGREIADEIAPTLDRLGGDAAAA